jgi:hypothetical protein
MFNVKGIYGGPFGKKGGFRIEDTGTVLDEVGKLAVKYIEQEATKVAGRSKGIPKSSKFLKSFSYKITGKSTLQIVSSWPFVKFESYEKGKKPWRVGKPGAKIPILDKASGKMVFRTVPSDISIGNCKVWCHPGIAKHTFVKRGLEKAKKEVLKKHGQTMVGQTLRKKQ